MPHFPLKPATILIASRRALTVAMARLASRFPAFARRASRSERRHPGRRDVIQMAATITLTYPFSPDDVALLRKLLEGNPGAGGTAANGAPSAGVAAGAPIAAAPAPAAPPAVDFFPADPGLAPGCPSGGPTPTLAARREGLRFCAAAHAGRVRCSPSASRPRSPTGKHHQPGARRPRGPGGTS